MITFDLARLLDIDAIVEELAHDYAADHDLDPTIFTNRLRDTIVRKPASALYCTATRIGDDIVLTVDAHDRLKTAMMRVGAAMLRETAA